MPISLALAVAVTLVGTALALPALALPPAAAAVPALLTASPAPSNSSQLVTVAASSSGATSGTLSAWQRNANGSWSRVFGPITAWVGEAGIGQAHEGSDHTPAGTFPLNLAFGWSSNPGTAMPYTHTTGDDWWDENPSSATYNTLVHRASSPGGASENLGDPSAGTGGTRAYQYAVNIGYNLARTPGAGSAFFLHITHNSPTAGCVAIDKGTLVSILRWLDPAQHPYINIRVGSALVPTGPVPAAPAKPAPKPVPKPAPTISAKPAPKPAPRPSPTSHAPAPTTTRSPANPARPTPSTTAPTHAPPQTGSGGFTFTWTPPTDLPPITVAPAPVAPVQPNLTGPAMQSLPASLDSAAAVSTTVFKMLVLVAMGN